jgi:hypothetical protein
MDDEGGSPHLLKSAIFLKNQMIFDHPPLVSGSGITDFRLIFPG